MPAQWPEKVDEERERANAALLLDAEIDRRIMDALDRNADRLADITRYVFARYIVESPDFEYAVARALRKNKANKG